MDFKLKTQDLTAASETPCDALIVLVPDAFSAANATTVKRDKSGKASKTAKVVKTEQTPEPDLSSVIVQALEAGDFESKKGKLLHLYRSHTTQATRTLLVGAGDGGAKSVKAAVTAAVAALKSSPARKIVLCLSALPGLSEASCQAAMLAVAEASYVYTSSKTEIEPRKIVEVTVGVNVDALDAIKLIASQAYVSAAVAGIEFAKEWANRPANYATPELLGKAAKSLSKHQNISCDVLGLKEVTKLGMGALIAVAQGSHEPLRFIVLKYTGAAKTQAPTVLVGKGITFDTGGISIKPAPEMDEMKFDMCGAASVLGTFRALADLQPAINVVGLIPACENMPDGKAIKPGDVVTSMNGQTIEILNTDAEGRLVLCDALTYAERFKPAAVIDIATLTGACVIALGAVRSGMFSTDDALATALTQAGESSGDLCWRLPLDDEYGEGLKTNFADVANVAGRAGGSITAAKFLQRFATKFPWAHLDIAGTAWKSGAAKGATGRPVALLLNYLLNIASNQAVAGVNTAREATKKIVKKAV